MTTLWIAEKPDLAKLIAKALGVISNENGYTKCQNNNIVTWAYGHVIQTIKPEGYNENYKYWNIETLPMQLFPIKYEPIPSKAKQVAIIKKLIHAPGIQTVVHAGDLDDEGQLIVDELLYYFGWKGNTKRVRINDMTQASVNKDVKNLKDNKDFLHQYKKAYARNAADLIYGYNMTRFMTLLAKEKGHTGTLNVGRVMTPTLTLIVDRYLKNKNHVATDFYAVHAILGSNSSTILSTLVPKVENNLKLDQEMRLIDKNQLESIFPKYKNSPAIVSTVDIVDSKKFAPLPYTTATLQQDMNKRFDLSAMDTQNITQVLREKYACISYNRTDCQYLSDEQYTEAPELVGKLKQFPKYQKLNINTDNKPKAFDQKKVTAHTAIAPTLNTPNLNDLTQKELEVYLAICERYLVQFLPPYEAKNITAIFIKDEYEFRTQGNKTINPGFTLFLNEKDEDEDEEDESSGNNIDFETISRLKPGDTINISDIKIDAKKTTAPKLYTEGTLITAMTRAADYVTDEKIKALLKEKDKGVKGEYGSIGTSATRGPIIENLKKNNFVTLKKKNLIPTESSINLINSLPSIVKNPDLTALWFAQQQDIESNEITVTDFIKGLYQDITNIMVTASTMDFDKIAVQQEVLQCPACSNGQLKISDKLAKCTSSSCEFKIWREIAGKKITEAVIKEISVKGTSKVIKGFKSKANNPFEAKLRVNDEKNGVAFVFENKSKSK